MAKLSDAVIKESVELYRKVGSMRQAAKVAGISKSAFTDRIRVGVRLGFITETQIAAITSNQEMDAVGNIDLNAEVEDPRDKRIASLERDNKIIKASLAQREKALEEGLRLRELVFGLTSDPVPVEWAITPPPTAGSVESCPVLFFSDAQWGEVVRSREMDGTNAFNTEIAKERYRILIDKTINIARDHMGKGMKYPGIQYLRGGDMVSGNIHQELRETNDLLGIPATQSLCNEEIEGVKKLKKFFKRVEVKTVAGNHGRDTIKPMAKGFANSNYDTLGAWMLESYFKDDKDVTFSTATSPDILFNIYDTKFLLTHGDRIGSRGGQGFIGAIATIVRGQKRIIEEYTSYGENIDFVLTGHFHEPCDSIYGLGNGSLPGYSEYAKSGRMGRPLRPMQWLFFVHPKHGVTAQWKLYLGQKPRLDWQHNSGGF